MNVDKDYFLCCRIPPIGNFNEDGTFDITFRERSNTAEIPIKKNIDPKITNRIWKHMIMSYIDFEKRNFKKK